MPPEVSLRTQQLVERVFEPDQVTEAARWLEYECGNNLPFCSDHDEFLVERIRSAVLKLSRGEMLKLLAATDEARVDWRDVLMAADFGHDMNASGAWAKELLES